MNELFDGLSRGLGGLYQFDQGSSLSRGDDVRTSSIAGRGGEGAGGEEGGEDDGFGDELHRDEIMSRRGWVDRDLYETRALFDRSGKRGETYESLRDDYYNPMYSVLYIRTVDDDVYRPYRRRRLPLFGEKAYDIFASRRGITISGGDRIGWRT